MIIWDMGKSIQTEADLGYFDERKGNQYVIGDIYQLQEMTRKKYPDVPYFMLGHSMGSFLLRQYLTMYAGALRELSLWEPVIREC